LCEVDRSKLGRLVRNHVTGERRRTSEIQWVGRFSYDIDEMIGEICVHSCDTVQELIDKKKSLCRIRRALVPISNEPWLPNTDRRNRN
jgi:hypothetical protein